jgi:hypothetical protein
MLTILRKAIKITDLAHMRHYQPLKVYATNKSLANMHTQSAVGLLLTRLIALGASITAIRRMTIRSGHDAVLLYLAPHQHLSGNLLSDHSRMLLSLASTKLVPGAGMVLEDRARPSFHDKQKHGIPPV